MISQTRDVKNKTHAFLSFRSKSSTPPSLSSTSGKAYGSLPLACASCIDGVSRVVVGFLLTLDEALNAPPVLDLEVRIDLAVEVDGPAGEVAEPEEGDAIIKGEVIF